jgi:hypothetical protein
LGVSASTVGAAFCSAGTSEAFLHHWRWGRVRSTSSVCWWIGQEKSSRGPRSLPKSGRSRGRRQQSEYPDRGTPSRPRPRTDSTELHPNRPRARLPLYRSVDTGCLRRRSASADYWAAVPDTPSLAVMPFHERRRNISQTASLRRSSPRCRASVGSWSSPVIRVLHTKGKRST